MSTYKINNEQLTLIKEKPFKLEKEIQNIVERNLQTLLGLDFHQGGIFYWFFPYRLFGF